MKLACISIKNYRSLTKAERVALTSLATLIGPNNEGKSNILRAIVTGMELVVGRISGMYFAVGAGKAYVDPDVYDWERDFPKHLQTDKREGFTDLLLEFELTEDELGSFKKAVGSDLNGTLPIQLRLGYKTGQFSVKKQGPAQKALSAKRAQIAQFLREHLELKYIPAIRTAEAAQRIIQDAVAKALRRIEEDARYVKAMDEIRALQAPIFKAVSEDVSKTLRQFLGAIKKVELKPFQNKEYLSAASRCQVIVDDGSPTLLAYKGDGVQSLAAIALMKYELEIANPDKSLVICIEEPESHLHPNAVHELRKVLRDMSAQHQVIMTTHCPVFVDRFEVSNNIVVEAGKATPAASIARIRNVLGVQAPDNLRNASLVLLVEGEDDHIALSKVLPAASVKIGDAIRAGVLAIEVLGGASKLSNRVPSVRAALCEAHAFLDDDEAGRAAVKAATEANLIDATQYTLATCPGQARAEIEDLYDPAVYDAVVKQAWDVDLSLYRKRLRGKWSDFVAQAFKAAGKLWDEVTEQKVKLLVAGEVAKQPKKAIHEARGSSLDSLVARLEKYLQA